MFSIWLRAITRPNLATYQDLLEEESNPTLRKALGWVITAGLIAAPAAALLSWAFGSDPAEYGWIVPIGYVISFLIQSAVTFVLAKLLGGQGTMASQSYLLAAAYAPTGLLSALLASLPVVGGVLGWLPSLYSIWLGVLAVRVAHQLSWRAAVAVIVTPLLIVAILVGLAAYLATVAQ